MHQKLFFGVYVGYGSTLSKERSTIYRWFIEYSPQLRKKLRRNYQFIKTDSSWQLDETYVKVKGKWHYLYRAINKQGETLDFYFSHKRNKEAAYQFLKRCLRYYDIDNQPKTLNMDKHSSHANAIARLKKEGGYERMSSSGKLNASIMTLNPIMPPLRN